MRAGPSHSPATLLQAMLERPSSCLWAPACCRPAAPVIDGDGDGTPASRHFELLETLLCSPWPSMDRRRGAHDDYSATGAPLVASSATGASADSQHSVGTGAADGSIGAGAEPSDSAGGASSSAHADVASDASSSTNIQVGETPGGSSDHHADERQAPQGSASSRRLQKSALQMLIDGTLDLVFTPGVQA